MSFGKLNILQHKSWNVWNRDNIEKVRVFSVWLSVNLHERPNRHGLLKGNKYLCSSSYARVRASPVVSDLQNCLHTMIMCPCFSRCSQVLRDERLNREEEEKKRKRLDEVPMFASAATAVTSANAKRSPFLQKMFFLIEYHPFPLLALT